MYDRMNKEAMKVIMMAQSESLRIGHNCVGAEQLLLGLIQGDNHGAAALKHCGVDLESVRAEVEKLIGHGSGFSAVEMPFTPEAKRVLNTAGEHALKLAQYRIGAEHILIGILAEDEGIACQIVRHLSTVESVQRDLETRMGLAAGEAVAQHREMDSAPDVVIAETPMFEQFTEKSLKVMQLARDEARRTGKEIGTEHILLGLLREKTGNAAKLLLAMSVGIQDVRSHIADLSGDIASSDALLYSAAARRLLGASLREAQNIGVDYIPTDYLLLGLLADDSHENRGLKILERLGVNLANLYELVTRTAVTESVLYRRPAIERLRARSSSEQVVMDALAKALRAAERETAQEKEQSESRITRALSDAMKSLGKAREVAVQENRFELAAWIGMQDQAIVNKFQEQGGSVLELNTFMKEDQLEASQRIQRMLQLIEGFNSNAVNVLRIAFEEPHHLGHNYVGTEHILLGLIAEDAEEEPQLIVSIGGEAIMPGTEYELGIAARVLRSMGVTPENARIELEKIIGRGPGQVVQEPPINAEARRLVEFARDEARLLDDETDTTWGHSVGTEHLLLALIERFDETNTARKLLANLGVDLSKLKSEILRLEPDARLLSGTISTEVISIAKREARLLGHTSIEPEHILLGLIPHEEGVAVKALSLLDVDLDNTRLAVEKLFGRSHILNAEEVPFSPGSRQLFIEARAEAKQLGHCYLGSEHLLLAIINNEDNRAKSVLEDLAVDLSKLRYEVTSRLVNLVTGVTGEKWLQ